MKDKKKRDFCPLKSDEFFNMGLGPKAPVRGPEIPH